MPKQVLLFQSHTHFILGGAELSLLTLLEDCVERGFETHVIVPRKGPFVTAAQKIGVHTHVIESYWWTNNGRNERHPRQNLQAINNTRKLIEQIKPSLCVTNTITLPWLAYAAHTRSTPHAWILREYGDTDHGLEFWVTKKEVCQMVGELSDKVFTNSEVIKEHYQPLVGHNDIGIIYPQVKQPVVSNNESPFKDKELKLVCVGNRSVGKGQLDAVKAVRLLRDDGLNPKLFLIGVAAEVEYEKKIKDYVASESLEENVKITGYVSNPANYVAYADFSLVCSQSETFGRVTIESLLMDTLVIGTDSANTRKLLQAKKEIMYTFGKPEELASKIAALYKKPPSYRQKLVRSLKSKVESLYAPELAHKEFFNYVSSLQPQLDIPKADEETYPPLLRLLQSQDQISLAEKAFRKLWFVIKSKLVRK